MQPREEVHLFREQTHGEAGLKPYEIVEPAMVVVDMSGYVLSWWSWRSLTDDEAPPIMKLVRSKAGGVSMPLVAVRPRTSDIVPSVQEYRQVKTSIDAH